MPMNQTVNYYFASGSSLAFGMAWHLDNGPGVIIDTILGWVYVSYKLTQYIFG
jgi:hypothetical protein